MSRALWSPALVLLLVLASYFIAPSNAHIGSPLSAIAGTPPTIDGFLSPGEWDSAAQVSVFSGIFAGSTFYVMNDANNLYFALRAVDSTLDPDDIMHVRFDNTHNSVHNTGDDAVSIRPGDFDDLHFVLTQSGFGSFANLDLQQNGSGAAGDEGITNFFEVSHPLNSGDPDDFNLSFGNTVGFCLAYFKEGTAVSDSMHPSGCVVADVQLSLNEQNLYGDIVIATPKPVTVTIIRFIQDQNPDPAPDTVGEFYARVSIGGLPFQDSKEDTLNATDISPFWTFTRPVNASLGTVPIEIQILDADPLDPDDVVDISPGNQTSVTLSLELNTCEWTGASGDNVGFSQGTSGRILFDVGCTSNGDIDLDGIPDGVERFGVLDDKGGLAADLKDRISDPARSSDPCRPTVAVEIDYMEARDETGAVDHTHRPLPEALKMVVGAFDSAPVSAVDSSMCPYAGFPTRSSGIVLILDVDDAISEQATLTFEVVATPAPGEQSFETVRDANFDFAKAPYFRYNLWVHDLEPMTTASGIGELGGNEFIVSLGSWTDQTGTILQQAGTLMHEIGHTLGLDHGGSDPNNFKPNYLSVMSYVFQTVGIINPDGTSAGIDYSREALPTLDETGLSEMAGILGPPFLTRWSCPQAETRLWGLGDGSLDWDCNETINPPALLVGADINEDRVCITPGRNGMLESSPGAGDVVVGSEIQDGGDRLCTSSVKPFSDDFQAREPATFQPDRLVGFDDWSNVDYVFRLDSADFDPGKSNLPRGKSNLPRGEELTFEQAQRIEAFWREVQRQISSSEEARPFYQGSSVQVFFTDGRMNPLPLDGEGNPKVDVILGKNGEVKGTNPGEVFVWAQLTNVAGEPISSVQFEVTLPVDWSARPPSVVKGSITVLFQFANGTRVEITNRASITISGLNLETVSVSVSDIAETGAKKNLGTGESVLVSVKIGYALKGTIQPPQQYPINYNTFATFKTISLPLFQGTLGSETASAFFVAHVKPRD